MKLTFLGTGTSSGNPSLGCDCRVCSSDDSHDHRLRTSALLETERGTRLLIDCGPDFRYQMLRWISSLPVDSSFRNFLSRAKQGNSIPQLIDGVLVTHFHYDHVGGLDDLRPFCIARPMPIYADVKTCDYIREKYPYCFHESKNTFVPRFQTITVRPLKSFKIKELSILPIQVMHGKMPILGFRIAQMAYLTDLKTLPEENLSFLKDLDTLVIDALQRDGNHPTHENIQEALALVRRLTPRRTYLIHMSHNAGCHSESQAFLPPSVSFAYDELVVEIPE